MKDGDFVDLLWSQKRQGPIVALFHGLAGSIDSAYINSIFHQLETNGYRPVFMYFRGTSPEPNRLAKTYHSGHTEDMATLLKTVAEREPGTPLHAVGFSLGANVLLKLLGEAQPLPPLASTIAVCPPLVLATSANRMNRGLSRVYQTYLTRLMRNSHNEKRRHRPELGLEMATSRHNTFWKFDNEFTAPLNGFRDVHDYYEKCSSRQFLASIQTRCHIIFSEDDPFFTQEVIPTEAELSDSVTLELTGGGGHVGFITGANPFKPVYWLDQRILELLKDP